MKTVHHNLLLHSGFLPLGECLSDWAVYQRTDGNNVLSSVVSNDNLSVGVLMHLHQLFPAGSLQDVSASVVDHIGSEGCDNSQVSSQMVASQPDNPYTESAVATSSLACLVDSRIAPSKGTVNGTHFTTHPFPPWLPQPASR